jgi:hypothetical protein
MDIPADSDYDNQEDIQPVVTELMPLEKQDPKLRVDYINLPEIPYVLCEIYIILFIIFVYI